MGESGPLGSAAAAAACRDPQTARDIRGIFVLIALDERALRVVSSRSMPATLRRSSSSAGVSWGTRALGVAAASAVPLRIETDRVAEFVHLDYVVGDDELLAGVSVLPSGTWLEITEEGVEEHASRAGPIRRLETAATDQLLEERLRREMHIAASDDRVALGLSAGRDSGLLALAAHRGGVSLPTFSMSPAGILDADASGALLRAQILGWPHEVASAVDDEDGTPWSRLQLASRWTEGSDHPRHSLGHLDWPRSGVTWLTGTGAEIGRAFYWGNAAWDVDPVARIMAIPLSSMAKRAKKEMRSRVGDVISDLSGADAGQGISILDDFYATQRMRKWVGRQPLLEQIDSIWPAFLHQDVVEVLISLPVEDKRTGAAFDRLLGDWGKAPQRSVPLTPKPTTPTLGARLAGRARRATRRTRATVQVQTPKKLRPDPLLDLVIQQMGPPSRIILPVLGAAWWEEIQREAERNSLQRKHLWNAIGIEAFAAELSS